VNRQRLLAAAMICALIGAFAYFGRGASHNLAAKNVASLDADPASPPASTSPSVPAAENAEQAASSRPKKAAMLKTVKTSPSPAPQTAPVVLDVDPHKAFGSKNAPVIMEVFSDFQCPACKTLFTTTNRQLMDDYVSSGKVYLIHRDFPLPMHAYSRIAARYGRAAAQIGKTEPVEQVLFQNQEKWEQSGDVDGTVASVLSPAEMTKVRALVKGGTLEPMIDKDYALGQGYRVSQTPTTIFRCKGQTYPYSGVMSYEILKQFLDQLLSQK
jgi:protein-disulfide isomerase